MRNHTRSPLAGCWVIALSVLLLWPQRLAGYGLGHDMVFTPRQPLTWQSVGLGSTAPRAVPLDALVALQSRLLDGAVLGRIALAVHCRWPAAAAPGRRVLAVDAGGAGGVRARGLEPVRGGAAGAGASGRCCGRTAALPWLVRTAWRYRTATGGPPAAAERLPTATGGLPAAAERLPTPAGRLRTLAGWRPLAALLCWLACCAITPTGALIGAAVAVGVAGSRQLRRLAPVLAAAVLVQLPWLVPALTSPAGATSDPRGVAVFAARSERPGGAPASLLGLGGIWNADVTPVSRAGLLGYLDHGRGAGRAGVRTARVAGPAGRAVDAAAGAAGPGRPAAGRCRQPAGTGRRAALGGPRAARGRPAARRAEVADALRTAGGAERRGRGAATHRPAGRPAARLAGPAGGAGAAAAAAAGRAGHPPRAADPGALPGRLAAGRRRGARLPGRGAGAAVRLLSRPSTGRRAGRCWTRRRAGCRPRRWSRTGWRSPGCCCPARTRPPPGWRRCCSPGRTPRGWPRDWQGRGSAGCSERPTRPGRAAGPPSVASGAHRRRRRAVPGAGAGRPAGAAGRPPLGGAGHSTWRSRRWCSPRSARRRCRTAAGPGRGIATLAGNIAPDTVQRDRQR